MDRRISPELLSRLNTLGDFLGANILGQDEVLTDIVDVLQPAFCELRFSGPASCFHAVSRPDWHG
jgi:hypothetical protein